MIFIEVISSLKSNIGLGLMFSNFEILAVQARLNLEKYKCVIVTF